MTSAAQTRTRPSALLNAQHHWAAYQCHITGTTPLKKTQTLYRNNGVEITQPDFNQRALLAAVVLGHGQACMTYYTAFSKMPETPQERSLIAFARNYNLEPDNLTLKAHLLGMATLDGHPDASMKVADLLIDGNDKNEERRQNMHAFYFNCGVRGLTDEHPLVGSLLAYAAQSDQYTNTIQKETRYKTRMYLQISKEKLSQYQSTAVETFRTTYLNSTHGPEQTLRNLLGVSWT